MEELSIHTVEAWLLDYVEGNLTSEQRVLLERFLDKNPEFALMLKEYEGVTLVAEDVTFQNKEQLKHTSLLNDTVFDTKCIEYYEGLLTKAQQIDFEEEIAKDPIKHQTALLFSKTKLMPDYSIQFYNKNSLKKRFLSKRIILNISYAAAASIILTAGVFVFEHYNELPQINYVAVVSDSAAQQQTNKPVNAVEEEEQIPEEILAKEVPVRLATLPKKSVVPNITDSKPVNFENELQNGEFQNQEDIELANYKGISVIMPIQSEIINTGNEMVAITSIESKRVTIQANQYIEAPYFMEKQFDGMLAKARQSLQAEKTFTAFQWAKRAVHTISKYTGAEMSLSRKVDVNGGNEEIAFESRFFGISRSSKK